MSKRAAASLTVALLLGGLVLILWWQHFEQPHPPSEAPQWRPIAQRTFFVPSPVASEIDLALRWIPADGSEPRSIVDLRLAVTPSGLELRQPNLQLQAIPPILVPLVGTGAQVLQGHASPEERSALVDKNGAVLDRALMALGVLRRAIPRDALVDEMAARGLEALESLGFGARVIYAWLDMNGSHAFVEIDAPSGPALLDPATASVVMLDGKAASAAEVHKALRTTSSHTLGMKQATAMPVSVRPDELLLFPPLYLRNFVEGKRIVGADGSALLSFDPNARFTLVAEGPPALRLEIGPRGFWIEAQDGPGGGWLEAKTTTARVESGAGTHALERDGFQVVQTIDMESDIDANGIANGVQPFNTLEAAELIPGFVGQRAQRIKGGGGGIQFKLRTAKGGRYVMAAYARALDGTLSSSIAGQVPPDLPRYAFTFPPNGWREVITPAFVSLGGIVTWFFYQDTPVSFEIDEVVLYELSQPTCSAAPDVVCEVGI